MEPNYLIKQLRKPLNLDLNLPGSKSITNRAFLIGMLAEGISQIRGALESDDTKYMHQALLDLDIQIQKTQNNFQIQGTSGVFPTQKTQELFLGNAGTAVRFLTAAMSLRSGKTIITGNTRMQERPIQDLIVGLQQIGVNLKSIQKNGCPPLEIIGNTLKGGSVNIPGEISSQYFSAILLTAPYAQAPVTLNVKGNLCSKPYIDITLDLMQKFGITVQNHNYQKFKIPLGKYQAQDYLIEGDASSASYFLALVALHGGRVKINNLSLSSKQGDIHFVDILSQMLISEHQIKTTDESLEFIVAPEPQLKGLGEIDLNKMPDVAMTLAIVAAFSEEDTTILNVANMRVKETDRIKALVTELNKCGIKAKEKTDGIFIPGQGRSFALTKPTTIQTYDDHRMAMCFAVLGTKTNNILIEDPNCTNKTYPHFWKDLEKVY